jgi:predicted CXXCH cytochrome family protein
MQQSLTADCKKQTIGFLSILMVIAIGLLFNPYVAKATPPDQENIGQDNSGRSCGDCHLDYRQLWSEGVHSTAYDDPVFQDYWTKQGSPPDCLQCHTTDYQPSTQTYHTTNIQCEACHDENPANHPPEAFVVRTDAGICSDCHTSTFDEWRHSLHSFNEDMGAIGCATCHDPHSQQLRFDTIDELCLNCHQDNPDNPQHYANTYVHLTHNEIQYETVDESVDVTCASCHMFRNHPDELHSLSNHSTSVTTAPCIDCHEKLSETGQFDTLMNVDLTLAQERDDLRERVNDLESELTMMEETKTESGPDYVQLTQGLILGLGIGITVIWVILRRSNGSNGANSSQE